MIKWSYKHSPAGKAIKYRLYGSVHNNQVVLYLITSMNYSQLISSGPYNQSLAGPTTNPKHIQRSPAEPTINDQ